jgi:hypothetical protein
LNDPGLSKHAPMQGRKTRASIGFADEFFNDLHCDLY